MSRYYVLKEKQSSAARDTCRHAEDGDFHNWASNSLADSATYIFPIPSSAPPSPSQVSDLSIPTDFTFSAVPSGSEIDILSPRPAHTHYSPYTSPSPLPDASEHIKASPWDWTSEQKPAAARGETSRGILAGPHDTRNRSSIRWDMVSQRQLRESQHHTRDEVVVPSRPFDQIMVGKFNGVHPTRRQARFQQPQLPFFSLLVSLLSIDESTVDLIANPSSNSALFEGASLSMLDTPNIQQDHDPYLHEKTLHGFQKLFTRQDHESNQNLRNGLAMDAERFYDTPQTTFMASAAQMTGFWNVLREIVSNSGKAVREVFQNPPED
ncbi:hypothetical protein B0H34DRAFT_707598 [Crassisporium funariophilum]|nr:hypothetical protein B0H34DRAFT_707598 [Crassisporium funariophilum]